MAWEGPGSPLRALVLLAGVWAGRGQVRRAGQGPGVSLEPCTFPGPIVAARRVPGARPCPGRLGVPSLCLVSAKQVSHGEGRGGCLFRLLAPRLPGGGPLGVWLSPSSHKATEAGVLGVCLAAGGPGPTEEVLCRSGCPGPARDGQLALASAWPWVSAPLGQAGRRPGGGWNPRGSQPLHRAAGAAPAPAWPSSRPPPLFWLQGTLFRHGRPVSGPSRVTQRALPVLL